MSYIIEHRRPQIIVLEKETKHCTIMSKIPVFLLAKSESLFPDQRHFV